VFSTASTAKAWINSGGVTADSVDARTEALQANKLATFLNSRSEFVRSRESALNGKVQLLYVAPERLLSERFLPFLD